MMDESLELFGNQNLKQKINDFIEGGATGEHFDLHKKIMFLKKLAENTGTHRQTDTLKNSKWSNQLLEHNRRETSFD